MNITMLRSPSGVLIMHLALLVAPSASQAAPPTLTFLYPAGAQQGQKVEITAGGTFSRWPVQVWTDRKDLEIKPARDKGKLIVAVGPAAVPGICWIRLHDEEGASELRPFLLGTLPEALEQEPNDEISRPQTLATIPTVVNGRLDRAGDVDCVALRLAKGATLVASLEGNRTLGSPMDAVLQVVSREGFVLEENHDDHGLDPQVVFTAPKEDTYIVRTFAFPSQPDASIRLAGGETYIYRLTLTTDGFADYAFPLAVARGEPASVEAHGWNVPADATKLMVKTERTGPTLLWHPKLANTLLVLVERHPCLIEIEPNERGKPQDVALPVTISGRIERPGDSDVYQFSAKKGQRLSFRVDAASLGSQLDPLLRLTDGSGKRLAQADDATTGKPGGRDTVLAFTIPQDGSYCLEVHDQGRQGSRRHFYRLRATGAEPDYALTVTTDRFLLTSGKPLDIPVTIARRDGFAGEIEIRIEGLPDEVTAPSVRSTGAGGKSVRLHLETKGKPVSAAFQIVGRVAGQDDLTRTAAAPRIKLPETTPYLWLQARK